MTDDTSRRLRAMLEEDTGSPDDAQRLLPAIYQLQRWVPPGTSPHKVTQLVNTLLPEMPSSESWSVRWRYRLANQWPVVLLRAQVRVVRSEIWIVSALVIVLGTLVTLLHYDPDAPRATLPIVLAAPVVTAGAVAFVYGPEVDPPFEVLLATPTSPRLVVLARLTLVYSFNLLLALGGSVTLTTLQTEWSLWPLISAWLAPMTFLSALAFFLGTVSRESLLSALLCLVLWFLQAVDLPYLRLPNLTAASAQPWLLLAAAMLGGVALWLAGFEHRWMKVVR